MAIERIGFGHAIPPAVDNTKAKDKPASAPGAQDKVELSEESLQLFAAERVRRFAEIRERVSSGFYESRAVTEKIVDGLLKDLKRPPTV
jgi:anti-sigma28 factor (negative regulator of flagellin synthesis)